MEPPDLLALVPDTPARECIRFCFEKLNLSLEETSDTLYDAQKLAQALHLLLRGKIISENERQPESP